MKIPSISSLFKSKKQDSGLCALVLAERGVYIARIKLSRGMPQVIRCEYHEMGSVTVAMLEKLRREADLAGIRFTTLLSPGEYQITVVEAPKVPVEELKNAIRWQIKDSLNYRIDDAIVDMVLMPTNKPGSERPQSIYAISASKEIIQKRTDLFLQAKLELEVIDIPELAQRNIAVQFEQDERAIVLLAFDDNSGLMTFSAGGELYLSRRIEIGAGQLQDVNDNIRQQSLDRVELELQRSLDYFDRQFNHLSVSVILVSAPQSDELIDFLTATLGGRVGKLDLAQAMDISAVPALADSEFAAYALPVLGAALREAENMP
jgi:MSHA biogenesis protein MshI